GVLRSDRVAATGPRRSPAASWQPIVHGIARPSVRPRGDFRIGGGRSNVPGGTAGLQTRFASMAPERFPSAGGLSNRPKTSNFGSSVGLSWGWPGEPVCSGWIGATDPICRLPMMVRHRDDVDMV